MILQRNSIKRGDFGSFSKILLNDPHQAGRLMLLLIITARCSFMYVPENVSFTHNIFINLFLLSLLLGIYKDIGR